MTAGCWHDEGRLYCRRDNWPGSVWGDLARATIPRFSDLEHRSGLQFSRECGFLSVQGPQAANHQA